MIRLVHPVLLVVLAAVACGESHEPMSAEEDECEALRAYLTTCAPEHVEEIVAACEAHAEFESQVTAFCGRADWLGNRGTGEACTFDWQCDSPLICRPSRSGEGQVNACLPLGTPVGASLWPEYWSDPTAIRTESRCETHSDCESRRCVAPGFCVAADGFSYYQSCEGVADPLAYCREALGFQGACSDGVCVRTSYCRLDADCAPDEWCKPEYQDGTDILLGYCSRRALTPGTCFTWSDCPAPRVCNISWRGPPGECAPSEHP